MRGVVCMRLLVVAGGAGVCVWLSPCVLLASVVGEGEHAHASVRACVCMRVRAWRFMRLLWVGGGC